MSPFLLRRFLSTSSSPLLDLPLLNARIQHLSRIGRIAEARQLFDTMPQRNTITWNSIILGLAQNNLLSEAHHLFDHFHSRNTRTWTILLSAYARKGLLSHARQLFDQMPEPTVISHNAMLSGYTQNGDLRSARKLFDEMLERDVTSWNAMLTGYCHAHLMQEARYLFELMDIDRNVVTWTVLISGYVQVGEYREAWGLFRKMFGDGLLRPDQSSFVAAISAVSNFGNLKLLENLRTLILKSGFEADVVIGSAILNAYTKNSQGLDLGFMFFGDMPLRNEYTWSTMISALSHVGRLDDAVAVFKMDPDKSIASMTAMLTGYAQNGKIYQAMCLFGELQNPNIVCSNAMLAGYTHNGMLDEAMEFFRRMPVKNSISWAAMISGCAHNRRNEDALGLLAELHAHGRLPSASSFTSGFFACANISDIEKGRQLHSLAIKAGTQFNSYVNNGLITMYSKCKKMEEVTSVFKWMRAKDSVSWNSLMAALSQNYMLDEARKVFESMPRRDVVSWTSIISAYVQVEQGDDALELFIEMLREGVLPNALTMTSVLSICGSMGAMKLGRQIHGLASKLGFSLDLFVGNAMITMYFKCGSVDSFLVFNEMAERDIVTWNSMLMGCGQHGFGIEAINMFEQMKAEGILPNHVTFLAVLTACSHAGLIDEGRQYFKSMGNDYGLMPLEGHYACLVDLLGRAGQLDEAEELIENMPIEPDSVVWSALLGACRIHQNVDIGRKVAERLFQMEPQNSGNYILLSNIYASLQMWDEVEEVRKLMRKQGVKKEPACSWMQIKNKMHYFLTYDKQHEQIGEIYASLKEWYHKLRMTGYVPDTKFVLHDVEEEQKENALLYHSEKLAVAYALMATPDGTPIHIMKSLRICGDCHTFFSFISKATGREIDIRDGNRFHHFRDGYCTCGNYW